MEYEWGFGGKMRITTITGLMRKLLAEEVRLKQKLVEPQEFNRASYEGSLLTVRMILRWLE